MLKSRNFVKKTRRGNVVRIQREVYLRDDIPCGSVLCSTCSSFPSSAPPKLTDRGDETDGELIYVVLDTNVVLQQIDVLEHPLLSNLIIPQTVLEESRHQNQLVYNRLREIIADEDRSVFVFSNKHHRETAVEQNKGESPNDYNDRAIRQVALWYRKHLNSAAKVILLTNDQKNREVANKDADSHFSALSFHKFLFQYFSDYPEVIDRLTLPQSYGGDESKDGEEEKQGEKRKPIFAPYLSVKEVTALIHKKPSCVFKGTFYANEENCFEGEVSLYGSGKRVLVRGRQGMNRATDGDVVAVKLLPRKLWRSASTRLVLKDGDLGEESEEENEGEENEEGEEEDGDIPENGENIQACGKVISVLERRWRAYSGVLQFPAESSDPLPSEYMCITTNKRMPPIRIATKQPEKLKGMLIVIALDSWDRFTKWPVGHYVRTLGPVGDRESETESILVQHQIRYQTFTKSVLACLPSDNWKISDEERAKRTDLRHLRICSVDPPGCTDIDDALHCFKLPNGNFEVGVHIADVTHFVRPDTPLDREASQRGVTVYLTDRRIDMLPELLGTNLCSLRSNVERCAFSCVWELTPEARIVNVKFFKSVINSKESFTYQQAQERIDDIAKNDELTQDLRHLLALSKKLKQRRVDVGALFLASPEIRFKTAEETRDPIDMEMYQSRDTNSMVEEFMLLANVSVAEKIYQHFPSCACLRRHPSPSVSAFDQLIVALDRMGVELDPSTSKTLAISLENAKLPPQDERAEFFNKLLRILSTRCLMQAVYFSSGNLPADQFRHYGLALDIYTHFTSPIRRYADVLVHRLLAAAIGVDVLPSNFIRDRVHRLTSIINHRHRMAQFASRSSVSFFTLIYFKDKEAVEVDSYITKVKENALFVLIPQFGVEEKIILDSSEKGEYKYNKKTQSLECRHKERKRGKEREGEEEREEEEREREEEEGACCVYGMFDKVVVRMGVVKNDLKPGSVAGYTLELQLVPKNSGIQEIKEVEMGKSEEIKDKKEGRNEKTKEKKKEGKRGDKKRKGNGANSLPTKRKKEK